MSPAINISAVHAFIALNLIGGIGMVLVLITATVSRKVKRLATWYSFCASWVLSSISYSMLFLAGQQTTRTPIYSLCYVQAALIYSMPPTTASTTLALLVQILLSLPDSITERPKNINLLTSCLLVMGPYTILLVLFIGVALYYTENPGSLQKNLQGTYCNSSNSSWSRVSFSVVAGVSMLIIVIQGLLVTRLYRRMRILKSNPQSTATTIRGVAFTVIGFATLVIAMVFTIANVDILAFDLVLATFPLLALLVFGTQKDLVLAWFSYEAPYRAEGRGSVFFGRDSVRR
ncbi:hypothetical protein BDZ97DRAFT_1846574 [Flammula alnicola]|nr:hypothetical protein BDZ97DRAFT_1846574 [Flammula alnicola]